MEHYTTLAALAAYRDPHRKDGLARLREALPVSHGEDMPILFSWLVSQETIPISYIISVLETNQHPGALRLIASADAELRFHTESMLPDKLRAYRTSPKELAMATEAAARANTAMRIAAGIPKAEAEKFSIESACTRASLASSWGQEVATDSACGDATWCCDRWISDPQVAHAVAVEAIATENAWQRRMLKDLLERPTVWG